MILRGQQRDHGFAVDEAEQGNLGAFEEGLEQDRVARLEHRLRVRRGLGAVRGDHDALAAGQAVVLDHVVGAELLQGLFDARRALLRRNAQRAGRAHACGGHDILGKRLRALQLGRGLGGAEDGDARLAQGVGGAGDQRGLRADHHELRLLVAGEGDDGLGRRGVDRQLLSQRRHTGVARCDDELVAGQTFEQGVFAAARTDNKDAHGLKLTGTV